MEAPTPSPNPDPKPELPFRMRRSFEEQCAHPTSVLFKDGKRHDVYDIFPGEQREDKPNPIIFIGGWNNPIPPIEIIREFTQRGRRVIFMKEAHGIDQPELYVQQSQFDGDAIQRISAGVVAMIEGLGSKSVDVVTQSQGSLAVLDAASSGETGAKIQNIFMMNPVITEDGGLKMGVKLASEMFVRKPAEIFQRYSMQKSLKKSKESSHKVFKEKEVSKLMDTAYFTDAEIENMDQETRDKLQRDEAGRAIKRERVEKVKVPLMPPGSVTSTLLHPILSYREVKSMKRTAKKVLGLMQELRNRGVMIGASGGVFDYLFRVDDVQKLLTRPEGSEEYPYLDSYVATIGSHGSKGFDKQHAAIESILTAFANRRRKMQSAPPPPEPPQEQSE